MDFINFHIAYLLTNHECVIIPDFGAFVVSKKINEKSNKRGFISPPASYSLTFNPEIIQDDELLVHSVAKEKHIDYPEALHLVHDYVDSLVDALREGQAVQFPWIGKIHLSDDRKIVFTPAKNLSCNASNCGLVNFNFPTLTDTSEDESVEKRRKKIYKRPVFYILLAAIVLLLAGLYVFLILKPLDINQFSFPDLPTISISNPFKANPVKQAAAALPSILADSVKPEAVDSVKPIPIDSTKLSPSEYRIIVFSTVREKDANVMLNYFVANGLSKAQIIHSDGKYRISIETFDNKEEALSFLDVIKKSGDNPLFKDAWIFEVFH